MAAMCLISIVISVLARSLPPPPPPPLHTPHLLLLTGTYMYMYVHIVCIYVVIEYPCSQAIFCMYDLHLVLDNLKSAQIWV